MDRNTIITQTSTKIIGSLSARRAWIEICFSVLNRLKVTVALRKESVDRNCEGVSFLRKITMSLSARRAWIEISLMQCQAKKYSSLSARRAWIEIGNSCTQALPEKSSLSARRVWIEIRTRSQPSRPRAVALRKESVDRN